MQMNLPIFYIWILNQNEEHLGVLFHDNANDLKKFSICEKILDVYPTQKMYGVICPNATIKTP